MFRSCKKTCNFEADILFIKFCGRISSILFILALFCFLLQWLISTISLRSLRLPNFVPGHFMKDVLHTNLELLRRLLTFTSKSCGVNQQRKRTDHSRESVNEPLKLKEQLAICKRQRNMKKILYSISEKRRLICEFQQSVFLNNATASSNNFSLCCVASTFIPRSMITKFRCRETRQQLLACAVLPLPLLSCTCSNSVHWGVVYICWYNALTWSLKVRWSFSA